MAIDFSELSRRKQEICARCLKPRSDHKWVADGDDWLLNPGDGAVLVEVDEEDCLWCLKFVSGEPLAGAQLLMAVTTELVYTFDKIMAAIQKIDSDELYLALGKEGVVELMQLSAPIRLRAKETITSVINMGEAMPDLTKKMAENVAEKTSNIIVGQGDEEAVFGVSNFLLETVRQHMHWCIGRDSEQIGGALVCIAVAKQKLAGMFGKEFTK